MAADINLRPCSYILTVYKPVDTCRELLQFFQKRSIVISMMHLQSAANESGILSLHVHISKDKINYISSLLKNNAMIQKIELMEGREIK
ncbi:MAG: hypothetical protein ABUT20_40305 [Bacteroidota bacterium]